MEGEGPPLVLGHGGGDSLEMWRKAGDTAALKDDFQLVLLDFPGHGRSGGRQEAEIRSEKPEDRREEAEGRRREGGGRRGKGSSDAVLAVMDSTGIDYAHYMGYSAGAAAGFSLALHHPERFHSFILGGMTPYAWPDTMVKAVNISIELYTLLLAEPEQYLFRMERLLGRPLTPEDREHFLSQDAEARIAGLSAMIDGPVLTDEDLAGIGTPCLVYCGDQDPFHAGALEAARHMRKVRFLSLPGLNHITALMRSDLVVPYVTEFIGDVATA
ncbi:MAG: hypothetical protein A2147_10440 [Chloroflexi bacterium RBG_16_57_8]|nr:MAG: hypothetical protein A2147_10440 [Chloroflexi bacterium RBG_16_57_8]